MSSSVTTKELFSFIWRYVMMQKRALLFVLIVSLAWSFDATLWPYILRLIIDSFGQYEAHRELAWAAIKTPVFSGLALWLVIEAGFRSQGFVLARVIPKMEADIRTAMFDHIQRHLPKYFNDHLAGSLSNKISDMTTHVTTVLHDIITIFIPAFATVVIATTFFATMQPFFALLLALWVLLHSTICIKSAKKCDAIEHLHSSVRSNLVGTIVDSLQNNFAVNLFFRFPSEMKRVVEQSNHELQTHIEAKRAVEKTRVILGVSSFIFTGLGINGLMIYFWLQGLLTTGEAAQIFNTTWNLQMIMWVAGMAIPTLFGSMGLLKQALSVMKDPSDILDEPNALPLKVTKGEIIFENVGFYYDEKKLFSNKSVHIPGGQKVGLVGYSGAGKSTFVNLILRLYPIQTGRIIIDGQDIRSVTLQSLRNQVALIPQDPLLFHRSLAENIAFGSEGATMSTIIDAARKAHVDEFVAEISGGYDAVVGERGTKLSGGQRQRIAIARAIIADAPIVILDEATSSLDSVTESYIQDSLEVVMQSRTVIAIAHRLSTLAKMDRILVFDKGKIIEDGSHEELLKASSHYAAMWQMQAGGFIANSPELQ